MGELIRSEVIIDATVLSKSDVATYAVVTKPFCTTAQKGEVQAGTSLLELANQLTPSPILQRFLKLYLGEHLIPHHLWHRVRLKPGAHVTGRVVPQGGGGSGKSPLRWILQLVVAVVAIVTTALTWGTLGPVWASLLGAAISFGGNMLVNMIAPVKPPKLPELSSDGIASPTYSISGTRNQLNPFGVIPRVLGKHRMTPPLGARPFTEIVGEDQYIWQLFVWGYGPLNITDIKIGETLFSALQDAQIETIQGWPGEQFQTLNYPDVFEESFNVVLENPLENNRPPAALGVDELWVTKTSQKGAKSLSIDILFPQGLVRYKESGETDTWQVTLQIRYRRVGTTTWTYFPDWLIRQIYTQPLRLGRQWSVTYDPNFQYEVQMRCKSQTLNDQSFNRVMDNVYWTTLRSIMPGSPVLMDGLCMSVVRVRATKQLNGVIDQLNGIASSILPVYENGNWNTWAETRNPGAHYRAVTQGAGNARPLADNKLHLADVESFYTDCKNNGYEFNMVRDFQASVWETLQDVCAAGRASPGHRDGKWTVIMDRPQATPVQMFTPRNSSNFRGTIPYSEVPHGFRIRFVNQLKNYDQDEMIVYADGYNADNATIFEGLEFPGITHPDLIWKLGRFMYAQALLRGEVYSFNTDIEHMVCTRGDLILCAHDVPAWSYSWGRVKAIITSGSDTTGVILDENVPILVGQQHAVRFRKNDGTMLRCDINSEVSGEFKTVTFVTPVATASGPQPGNLFSSGVVGEETRELLVLGIKPGRDMSATLICCDYSPAVYEADQGTIPPFESGISDAVGIGYPIISSIRSDEGAMARNNDGTLVIRALVNFAFLSNRLSEATAIEIQSKLSSTDEWTISHLEYSFKANVPIEGYAELQTYDFRARYQFSSSNFGDWSPVVTHTIVGKTTRPPAPTNIRLEGPSSARYLVWDILNPPIDVAGFYVSVNEGNDTNPDHALPMHPDIWRDSPFPLGNQGLGEKTFIVRTVDAGGLTSENVAYVIVNLGSPVEGDDVHVTGYHTAFEGYRENASIVLGHLEANAEGADLFWGGDDTDFYWEGSDSDAYWTSGAYLEMTYEFAYQPDATWVNKRDVQIYMTITGSGLSHTIEWAKSSYFWTGVDADLFWTGSDSDLFWDEEWDGSTYLPWLGATNDVSEDLYVFRLVNPAGATQAIINTLRVAMRAPSVSEDVEDVIVVSPAGTRIQLQKEYTIIRSVTCDIQDDGNNARSIILFDKDPVNGPLVKAYNAAGTQVAALIDAHVRGN